jgi:6-phosphogluconolactonase (cycloisomerase 2 family)
MSRIDLTTGRLLPTLALMSMLSACGGGGDDGAAAAQYTVGGTVTGLSGTGLAIQNAGAGTLAIGANGTFTFSGTVVSGGTYAVSVSTQPANQVCTVQNGSGTVTSANVTNITITCASGHNVSGTAFGVIGSGLALKNNGGPSLAVASNGAFTFPEQVISGSAYSVTVDTQPLTPSQTCTVANGSGTMGDADITNINVTCVTNDYAIRGTVNGLSGSGLKLRNNGGDELSVSADGAFAFAGPIKSGSVYAVTVATQPTNPSQACIVTNGSGHVPNGDVTNVAVTCSDIYPVGGTLSGLSGSGLKLRLNGSVDLAVASGSGTFVFPTQLASGAAYSVAIAAQPSSPTQTCAIGNASGVMAIPGVTNIAVTCTTNTYAIHGRVRGLVGTGLELQFNGANDMPVGANGAFSFPGTIASGAAFDITVKTQPGGPTQQCILKNAHGIVANADIDATITCTQSPGRFAYSASPSGLRCFAIDGANHEFEPLDAPICAAGNFASVAAEPSGAFVYARESGTQTPKLFTYAIDQATGALSPVGTPVQLASSPFLVMDPLGRFVFLVYDATTGHSSGSTAVYSIDSITGALTPVPGSPFFDTGSHASRIAIDPNGKFLVVGSQQFDYLNVLKIDQTTGALTPSPSPFYVQVGYEPFGLAFDRTSKFLFATFDESAPNFNPDFLSVLSVDNTTAAVTPIAGSPFATAYNLLGATITDITGAFLYVTAQSNGLLAFTLDSTTGAFAPIAGSPFASQVPFDLLVHPAGGTLYVLGVQNGQNNLRMVSVFNIDPTTGALTAQGSPTSLFDANNLTIAN